MIAELAAAAETGDKLIVQSANYGSELRVRLPR